MSLTNFSLPYQSPTLAPFLYMGLDGRGHTTVNNLNAVLPAGDIPNYSEQENYRHDPYVASYYQQRRQPVHREVYTEHSSFSSTQDTTRYSAYNQDFHRTLPRQHQTQQQQQQQVKSPASSLYQQQQGPIKTSKMWTEEQENFPERPNGYTRVNDGGGPGAKSTLHAVLDYDDDYYDDDHQDDVPVNAHVTPIQGPIFLKNGSVPVVPLYTYPQLNNGTFVQIPILWTALSVALGIELRGDLVRGSPCVKKYHQLFCPTAGNTYPIERIENFIDENKALMKRMYGEFEMSPGSSEHGHRTKRKNREARKHGIPDGGPRGRTEQNNDKLDGSEGYYRSSRQPTAKTRSSGRIDACESKIEIITPYWASNSAGKIRAIVNTQHFEQAIYQETCSEGQPNRCSGDCGCEQKYKWHRLLAYDPSNDCKGIFMDWFLFPSCCVCRCDPMNEKLSTGRN